MAAKDPKKTVPYAGVYTATPSMIVDGKVPEPERITEFQASLHVPTPKPEAPEPAPRGNPANDTTSEIDPRAMGLGPSFGLPIALLAVLCAGLAVYLLWPTEQAPGLATPAATPEPEVIALDTRHTTKRFDYTIGSVPPGARVLQQGVELGVTPLNWTWPAATPLKVSLSLSGYDRVDLSFDGRGEETLRVVQLKPYSAGRDWIRVKSEPLGAEVFVNTTRIGTTPFEWRPEVRGGPTTLEVCKPGYATLLWPVQLSHSGDVRRSLSVPLIPVSNPTTGEPMTRRWSRRAHRRPPRPSAKPAPPPKPQPPPIRAVGHYDKL